MKNNFLQEIFVSLALIVLLVLFLNPFGFWMPNALLIMMIAGLIVVFALFASFIWRETAQDEREALHRFMAGRIAYLSGAGGLVIGIIIQSLQHNLDGWLVGILGIMIFAKIIGLIYGRIKY
ncbi:hypothetical protein L0244_00165 [bacterium]|nr:hypothetical protein [bacterium]